MEKTDNPMSKNETIVLNGTDPEGHTVEKIAPKAYLNCRQVKVMVLPETVREIGDWAFAHMKRLETLYVPAREVQFGKKVFMGCESLVQIIPGQAQVYEGIPYFLATSVHMYGERLLDLALAGDKEGQWKWLLEYDEALLSYLKLPQEYGYEPVFIGWFDVEDVDDQRIRYIVNRKKNMIRMVFQRFAFSENLTTEKEEAFRDFLLGRTDPEIPGLVAELFGEEDDTFSQTPEAVRIWQRIGGFAVIAARELLAGMPQADPEVRAFLMEVIAGEASEDDFFEGLAL